MKIDIHHHHHWGAEEKAILLQLQKTLLPVGAKLDGILEKLNFMADQEQQLNENIAGLRDVTVDGFKSISEAVDKAAQRVIQRLEEKDIDLSDEIGILNQMKSTTRELASGAVQRLDQIAAPIRETDPPDETTGGGEGGGGETEEETTGEGETGGESETGDPEADTNPFPPSGDSETNSQ